jgi:hypothetical protein
MYLNPTQKGVVVDEAEGHAVAEWSHIEAHIVSNVAQTNFKKLTETCRTAPRRSQQLARKRSEDTFNITFVHYSANTLETIPN